MHNPDLTINSASMEKKNLTIIYLTTLMAVLGVASLAPAFPAISEHFNISITTVTLLITIFTLPGIFLAPVIGIIADHVGRKPILIASLVIFGISGLACFFVKTWEFILVLRFLQGIGAASLGSLNVTLIGDLFSGKRRGEIMGYNASVLSIGTAAYPAIGGGLALSGWHFPFLLPGLALPIALLAVFWLKNPEPDKQVSIKKYLSNTWKNINKKTVWGIFLVNVLLFVLLYGAFLSYFPPLLKERLQASTFHIGLLMSAFSVVTALTASQKKRIDNRLPVKHQLLLGITFYIATMLILSFANNWWHLVFPLLLFGMGHGMLVPGIQTLLVGFAPLAERAGFMSINSMVLRIGQTTGPLFIGLFYTAGGVTSAFIGGALVAVIMFVLTISMVKANQPNNLS
uniref:MFS transporter n=1 Tax=uncultured Draconibacterium sp. TaxID=1573823 RepID=UPI0032167882